MSTSGAFDNRTARYRSLSLAAVLSLVAGALSVTLFVNGLLLPVPIVGMYLGWRALKRIARTPEEFTGVELAWTGIGLSAFFLLAGSGWLLFRRASEVPYGYQRIEYAELQPDQTVEGQVVPPGTKDLDGKKVFIKGYMYPGRQQVHLRWFLLCPTNGVCTFCLPNPRPTELIDATLTGDLETQYTTQLIGIGGKFHVDPDDPHKRPYKMDVDCLR